LKIEISTSFLDYFYFYFYKYVGHFGTERVYLVAEHKI